VIPAGQTDKGNAHKLRLYSIASPTKGETGDGTIMSTCTKRVVDEHWDSHELMTGVCSNYMCDLKVGDPIAVTGPAGKRFVLPKDPSKHDYMFIATGTGIAPFRSMISDLIEQGIQSKVTLIMGAPYATDLLYHDTMAAWADEHDNFSYRTAISRHLVEGQSRKLYVQDRLTEDADEILPMLGSERTLIYVCGIAGMELGILQTLARMLSAEQLAQYLTVAPEIGPDIDSWERKMIPRKIKPTKRVFLEVY
jgi:ferredoxin--NADP+ reductase